MSSELLQGRIATLALVSGFLLACGSTNTGNPARPSAPEGIDVVTSGLARETEPALEDVDLARFGQTSVEFAFALYHECVGDLDSGDNALVSPVSVREALAMLFAGANGDTEVEMRSALGFLLPEPTLHAAFNATSLALAGRSNEFAGDGPSSGDLVLRLVNATFAQRGISVKPEYLDILAVHYGSGVYLADFANQAERERMVINSWVEERTENRIMGVLPEGSITSATSLVLVNAVYFKGSWLQAFDRAKTGEETFHALGGDVSVPTMNGRASMFAEGDGYKAVEIPYITPAVRMLFIMPDEGRFDDFERRIDGTVLAGIRNELSPHLVQLKVPRFRFESSFKLKPHMQALGMVQAFEQGAADLSGIAGDRGSLYVAEILHKTMVAVDEDGTEAAAATVVLTPAPAASPPPAEFFFNRPGLFVVYDEPTSQILFMGRLMSPRG